MEVGERCISSHRSPLVITSEMSTVDVVPDGDLEKETWSAAKRIQFAREAFGRTKCPRARTEVASRWTVDHLYMAFWCHYQSLNVYQGEDPTIKRWGLWERDVVELFINPRPEHMGHYYEFEIAPNNQWLDLEINLYRQPFNNPRWNSGFEHATKIYPKAHIWTAEMRIPMASITKVSPRHNDEWRVNFYRCDGSAEQQRRYMSWGPLPRSLPQHLFHQPASFGVLRLIVPEKVAGREIGGQVGDLSRLGLRARP
jgi:hypothetical protein